MSSGREHRHCNHGRHTHADSRNDSVALSARAPPVQQTQGYGTRRDHSQAFGRLSGTEMLSMHLRKNDQKGKEDKVKDRPDCQQDDHCPGTMRVHGPNRVEHTAGLIAQLKGKPTISRYQGATIYVDHFSRLSFVYLQKQLTSEEPLKGKKAFERYCEARGVMVKHYHADNGRFADNAFVNHVATSCQSISQLLRSQCPQAKRDRQARKGSGTFRTKQQ